MWQVWRVRGPAAADRRRVSPRAGSGDSPVLSTPGRPVQDACLPSRPHSTCSHQGYTAIIHVVAAPSVWRYLSGGRQGMRSTLPYRRRTWVGGGGGGKVKFERKYSVHSAEPSSMTAEQVVKRHQTLLINFKEWRDSGLSLRLIKLDPPHG